MAKDGDDMEKVERLCDEAEAALNDGDGDQALELAEQALGIAPADARALLVKAEALFQIEDPEDAEEALDAAIHAAAADARTLAHAANLLADWRSDDHESVERALEMLARAEKLARAVDDPLLPSDIAWMQGRAHGLLDDLESSLKSFERAHELAGDAAEDDLLVELAIARFEMRQFDAARNHFEKVLSHDRDHPDAVHYLGLIAERSGDAAVAERHFARARKLDPEAYPRPVRLSEQEFEAAIETALEKVPEKVREALANVVISVAPMPDLDDLVGPPALSPLCLGLFRGPVGPGTEAARQSNALPCEIVLYQANLERYAEDRAALIEQIEQTLLHEIGHFVGWDEDDLYERGLH